MFDLISTDLLRIAIIIPVLIYASYTDILSRQVKDSVWAVPTFFAISLLGYDAYTGDALIVGLSAVYSFLTIGGFAYIIYKLRIFYGADYKAFLLIAILFPWHPVINSLPLYNFAVFYDMNHVIYADGQLLHNLMSYSAVNLYGFTVFVNTMLFSITYFILNIIHNIQNDTFKISKPLRSTCARQVPVSELDTMYAQIIDEPKSDNKFKKGLEFIYNGLNGLSTDFFKDYESWYSETQTVSKDVDIHNVELKLKEFVNNNEAWISTNEEEDIAKIKTILNKDMVWVTPGVPFIVPITLGVITSILFGNMIYILLSLII